MSQSAQINEKPEDKSNRADLGKALKDLRKKIYLNINLTPEDSSGNYINGLLSRFSEKFDDAITLYSKAIELDQDNPGLYSSRGEAYWQMKEYEKSMQDYNKALELDNLDVDKFFEGPFDEISKMILLAVIGNCTRGIVAPEKDLESFLEASCKKIINRFPEIPSGYLHLGIYYLAKNNYSDAIDNFTKYITLATENNFGFFLRGICFSKIGEMEAANSDFSNAAGSKIDFAYDQVREDYCQFGNTDDNRMISHLDLIKNQLEDYTLINNTSDYSKFLEFVGKNYSIYIMIISLNIFFGSHKVQINDDMITLSKYLDRTRFEEIEVSIDMSKLTSEIFSYYPQFTSLSDVLQRDTVAIFRVNAKLSLLKYLSSNFIPLNINWALEDSIEYHEGGFLGVVEHKEVNQQYNFTHTFIHLTAELQRELTEIIIKKDQEKARALVNERNKIIADLSHSIKNLISTVIDPLENLKQEKIVKPAVIRNALRGANLVREIVNAMNLSFKGSIEDFYYDARNNTGKGKIDLESIINESLIYSIGNMFDGKYFSNYVRKYFPTKNIFEKAKSEWTRISQSNNVQEIMEFLQNYFFEIELAIVDGSKYMMGNEKGSAMKLLILFQELILNAVKYSAFMNIEKRFVHIKFDHDPREISIKIENRYKEKTKTKTSGIGHVIVENFAKLLNTKPIITKNVDIYSVEIKFENFWREKINEDSIC